VRRLIGRPPGLPWWCSVTAAAGIFVGGYIHWYLFEHGYRFIPTIGVLFETNVVASSVVGVAVLFRRELIVRLAGLGVVLGTLAAFGASRLPGGIFHFQERGLQPAPQALIALVAELVALAGLGVSLAWDLSPLSRRRLVPS
jgi:hypothetical protein